MKTYLCFFKLETLNEYVSVVTAESKDEARQLVIGELNRLDFGADEDDLVLRKIDKSSAHAFILHNGRKGMEVLTEENED